MKTDFLQAIIYIVIVICIPIFVFGAVLALISIDKYIQKIEKHLKAIAENTADMQLGSKRAENNTSEKPEFTDKDDSEDGQAYDDSTVERKKEMINKAHSEDYNDESAHNVRWVLFAVVMILVIIIMSQQNGFNS